jgi:hypothetical protein
MIIRSNGNEVTLNQHNLPKNSELSEQYECTHARKKKYNSANKASGVKKTGLENCG